jgi:hypothetical protein
LSCCETPPNGNDDFTDNAAGTLAFEELNHIFAMSAGNKKQVFGHEAEFSFSSMKMLGNRQEDLAVNKTECMIIATAAF